MIKEGLGKKAPKKKQQLVPKLTSLNEEIKMKVIKMYLQRQIIRHQFLVFEYYFRKYFSG
jgi:ribosomal protein S19